MGVLENTAAQALPLIKKAVQARIDADAAERELQTLLGFADNDDALTSVTEYMDIIHNTTEECGEITVDEAATFVQHVCDAMAAAEDEDGEDDDEESGNCAVCGEVLDETDGDNWDNLCPGCADRVSEYMDEHEIEDGDEAGRDRAIEAVKHADETCDRCGLARSEHDEGRIGFECTIGSEPVDESVDDEEETEESTAEEAAHK